MGFLDDRAAGNGPDQPEIPVDVAEEAAHDPQTDGIPDIVEGRFGRNREPLPPAFFFHAGRAFHPVEQMLVGVFSLFLLLFPVVGPDVPYQLLQHLLQHRPPVSVAAAHGLVQVHFSFADSLIV